MIDEKCASVYGLRPPVIPPVVQRRLRDSYKLDNNVVVLKSDQAFSVSRDGPLDLGQASLCCSLTSGMRRHAGETCKFQMADLIIF